MELPEIITGKTDMSNSKIDTDTLHNVIKLEIQKGYSNTAVVGGLNLFIYKLADEVRKKNKVRKAKETV